ncbi:hypothetical protein FBBNIHIM_21945 [Pseudocitrobacter vendiensis]|uniref:Uncharacterized protein n=1 Tax=Pseudocitrobacter vendiensis TaxID=2488306 RepID=A0ABM9FEX3_9ENTR|nr:hypothetical protein FBBNIHIM_21945 [Pseudocitrobacter vendiensis]
MWMKHYLRLYPMTRFIHQTELSTHGQCLSALPRAQHPTRVVMRFISIIPFYYFEIFLNNLCVHKEILCLIGNNRW